MVLGAASAPSATSHVEDKQCGQNCDTCQAPSSPSSSSKPSLRSREEHTLSKRLIPNPMGPPWNGNLANYVSDHLYGDLQEDEWVNMDSSRGVGKSIGTLRELGDEPWVMQMGQLSGCTATLTLSQKALFLTHHWEVGAYSPGGWQNGTQERFKSWVLDELWRGGGSEDMPSLRHVMDSGDFARKYNPAAMVFQRRESGRAGYDSEYNAKNMQLGRTLYRITGIVPKLAKYTPLFDPLVDNDLKGMIFIQYDPKGLDDGCGGTRAQLNVWLEQSLAWTAHWARLPHQGSDEA